MPKINISEALKISSEGTKKYIDNIISDLQKYVVDKIQEYDDSKHIYEPDDDDIPRVYFSGGLLPVTKDFNKLKMRYVSKTYNFECYVNIKCQGTSSMAYPKKNFSIRLYEDEALENKLKMNFKGWGEQYKFVLKANYIDLSHARNVVSSRLWTKCVESRSNFNELPEELKESPALGAIDGFFIKVYHEGVYQGRYTFNIPKDPWMTNMDEDNEQHCLLCSENYDSGCFRAPAVIDETDWTDEIHKQVPQSILTRWNEVIDFVRFSSDEEFKNNLSDYFDVESLIDYYCYQFMICGLDSMGKNQIYITYDGNKWFATAYDMDSVWGSYWDGSREVSPAYRMQQDYESMVDGRQGNLLYFRLEQLFSEEIYDRYWILRNGPMSLTSVIEEFEDFVSVCTPDMIAEDYEIFPGIPGQDFNNIKQIRSYAVNRYNYCDDCINETLLHSLDDITANILYKLPNQTTFDGNTYINTGIKLFDTAKDWTIILYGHMDNLAQEQNTVIIHCMNEDDNTDYPGLAIQCVENNFIFTGSSREYFPGHAIRTNSFKMALVCKDGMITLLKYIENFGVESYKAASGQFVQVNKDLIIGAYQDEAGNYGRYWRGELFNLVVYDQALEGGELNYVLKKLPPPSVVLLHDHDANNQAFSRNVDIDWETQELFITCNLDTCWQTTECTLSFGNNIDSWAGNNVHFYYTKGSGRMLIQCMEGGSADNIEVYVSGTMEVRFNNNGLYINGNLYPRSEHPVFEHIYKLKTIKVGSTEGAVRSTASDYHIETRIKY